MVFSDMTQSKKNFCIHTVSERLAQYRHLLFKCNAATVFLDSGVGVGGANVPSNVLICGKLGQSPLKSGLKWRPTLLDFEKWHPTFTGKYIKTFLCR